MKRETKHAIIGGLLAFIFAYMVYWTAMYVGWVWGLDIPTWQKWLMISAAGSGA